MGNAQVKEDVTKRLEAKNHELKVDVAEQKIKTKAMSKQAAELQALARVREVIPGASADDLEFCAARGIADEDVALAALTDRWKAKYRHDEAIKAEFASVADFLAFKKHEAIGDARILGEK